jgi:hypothetical protein
MSERRGKLIKTILTEEYTCVCGAPSWGVEVYHCKGGTSEVIYFLCGSEKAPTHTERSCECRTRQAMLNRGMKIKTVVVGKL